MSEKFSSGTKNSKQTKSTAETASHCILRTYQQANAIMVDEGTFYSSKFGWQVSYGKLMSIKMENQSAPQRLLSKTHCKCKTNNDKKCFTGKKNMDCIAICLVVNVAIGDKIVQILDVRACKMTKRRILIILFKAC